MSSLNPFHLAIPVKEITETRYFYRDILGCEEGRSSDHWVDFNFFGHQLVLHIDSSKTNILNENSVDAVAFGVLHVIGEDRCARGSLCSASELGGEARTMKNVIA